jgi:LPPG:FO 2-phospho-L-lactate transferase
MSHEATDSFTQSEQSAPASGAHIRNPLPQAGPISAIKALALAGGVGGAKLAYGLQMALPQGSLSVVVNTGDDFKLWGLHISPDLDTVMYTLAGRANRAQGWGIEGETWSASEMLAEYGRDTWFRLGDKDIVTHVLRTQMLHEGKTLTEATRDLASALGVTTDILPMSDEPVETLIQTPEGSLDFQEYFVRRRHADTVTGVLFRGIAYSQPTQEVLAAIAAAEAIIFCPSNPIVSIGPILSVPGVREALAASLAPKVAVSPIVGGAALKGPAADMLASLGHEVSPLGVAAMYYDLIDGIIIDRIDEAYAPRIRELGIEVEITDTIMKGDDDRRALAETSLRFCNRLAAARQIETR